MFVLIVDWARPGSSLCSVVDGHNEILQIPGILELLISGEI